MTTATQDLTSHEALALAKAAWDRTDDPDPQEHQHAVAATDPYWGFHVGVQSFSGYSMKGHGSSWQEACARAGLLIPTSGGAR